MGVPKLDPFVAMKVLPRKDKTNLEEQTKTSAEETADVLSGKPEIIEPKLDEADKEAAKQVRNFIETFVLDSVDPSNAKIALEQLKGIQNTNPLAFEYIKNKRKAEYDLQGDFKKLKINFWKKTNLKEIPGITIDDFTVDGLVFVPLSVITNIKINGANFDCLPNSFGRLSNLKSLDLYNCSSLGSLPDSFGNLTNLQSLSLEYCDNLLSLPNSFGNLTNLQSLNLFACKKLSSLPDTFGKLYNLQSLDLSACRSLNSLPDSFGNLTNLQSLNIKHSTLDSIIKLQEFPSELLNLTNLHSLNFQRNKIKKLPPEIKNLSNLQALDLAFCRLKHNEQKKIKSRLPNTKIEF